MRVPDHRGRRSQSIKLSPLRFGGADDLLRNMPSVVVPDNGAVVLAGQKFVAGTMWFRPDSIGALNRRFMNDFSAIQEFEPWVYEQNVAFEKALVTHVEAGDVVVTHHLPAQQSVPSRFVGSAIKAFFVCDMASYLRELRPKLWIHGHTHDRCDYVIEKTRVVANPLSYPKELRSLAEFDPTFLIDV